MYNLTKGGYSEQLEDKFLCLVCVTSILFAALSSAINGCDHQPHVSGCHQVHSRHSGRLRFGVMNQRWLVCCFELRTHEMFCRGVPINIVGLSSSMTKHPKTNSRNCHKTGYKRFFSSQFAFLKFYVNLQYGVHPFSWLQGESLILSRKLPHPQFG